MPLLKRAAAFDDPDQPMPLLKRAAPFDDPAWIFELKYDGFRALAVIEHGRAQLISRNGHPFASFATALHCYAFAQEGPSRTWGESLAQNECQVPPDRPPYVGVWGYKSSISPEPVWTL